MTRRIHLGFEIESGQAVEIPVKHMAITGQTQESGKTTTLEALIHRSDLPAIAFVTKRGEGSFHGGNQIRPYFQERTDWPFVESILRSVMLEKMKYERRWIVRACRGAKALADVQKRCHELQAKSKNDFVGDMYMLLGEYLDRVVPLIAALPKSPTLALSAGLNVMDLSRYPQELQMLVISSTLDWIHQRAEGVITIIPEAWKFVPQSRNTPVKFVVEKLAREGAGLKNYIWLDAQDLAGVDKMLLRACAVWLMGVQREANEVRRALANMPGGIKKPKADDLAMLGLGDFFLSAGRDLLKVYVQPAWMDEDAARKIATGARSLLELPHEVSFKEEDMGALDELRSQLSSLQSENAQLRELLRLHCIAVPGQKTELIATGSGSTKAPNAEMTAPRTFSVEETFDNERLYQAIKNRLIEESPGILASLAKTIPEITVTVKREKLEMDTSTLDGRVAALIADGFFDERRGNKDVLTELSLRGWPDAAPNVSKCFSRLIRMGFLRDDGGGRYKAVAGMKVNILESVA
jgi:hypothetical protein